MGAGPTGNEPGGVAPIEIADERLLAWLAEDVGSGDVTAQAVVPAAARARATLIQKRPGVLAGLGAAGRIFELAGAESFEALAPEALWRDQAPAQVARIEGPARAVLAGERTALNLLARLSGVATLAAEFVRAAAAGGPAVILDTRKTTPGWRRLEKAAVTYGGAVNHRMGLDDAILIKENHAAMAGGVGAAVEQARAARPDLPVEVECRNLAEVEAALIAGADRLLLDNMDPGELTRAVATRNQAAASPGSVRAELEASGSVDLGNVASVAATGVDFISVGALTHSAPALDLSLIFEGAE